MASNYNHQNDKIMFTSSRVSLDFPAISIDNSQICDFEQNRESSTKRASLLEELPLQCVCNICSYVGVSKKEFYYHMSTIHSKDYKCDICNEFYNSPLKLASHYISRHTENWFKCCACYNFYKLRSSLDRHKREYHIAVNCNDCNICQQNLMLYRKFLENAFACDITIYF